MTEPRLRGGLLTGDRPGIARILASAGVFRTEAVGVALELVDETLALGPRSPYRWFLAERIGGDPAARGILGFACYGPVPLTVGTYDLYWIAVGAGSRGSGVAARLEGAVTDAVRRAGARWLLAETSSAAPFEPARRFYLRRGYDLLGRIPDYYRPGEDRLTYGKRLAPEGP